MTRLPRLDFHGGPPRPWLGWAAFALSACALVASLAYGSQRQAANEVLAGELARSTGRAVPRSNPADRARLASGQKVDAQLRAPWGELLSAFESQGSADVGLLRLEPDARTGLVRVTGQARDMAALFAYLKALEADPRLRHVALLHHELETDTPGRPLRFVLQASWRPGAPPAKDPA